MLASLWRKSNPAPGRGVLPLDDFALALDTVTISDDLISHQVGVYYGWQPWGASTLFINLIDNNILSRMISEIQLIYNAL